MMNIEKVKEIIFIADFLFTKYKLQVLLQCLDYIDVALIVAYAFSLVLSLKIDDRRQSTLEKLLIFRVCLNDFMKLNEVLVSLLNLVCEFEVFFKMFFSFFKKIYPKLVLVASRNFVEYKLSR